MSALPPPPPGDRARVEVLVHAPPDVAFEVFTAHIDQWWRRGLKYRVAGKRSGFIHIEPRVGGRLFESFDGEGGSVTVDTGRVLVWEPPSRLVFEWRSVTFGPGEATQVEVSFQASPSGTRVRVTHRGWSTIRPDHPVRHGQPRDEFIRSMGLWWGDLLSSLRTHVDDRRQP